MLFNIPQFIDKEDKIVGPLTVKQLGWIFAGGAVMLVFWTILDFSAFITASVPIVLVFGALAFYRPNGQPLIKFITSSVLFLFHPKIYVWKRLPEKFIVPKKSQTSSSTKKEKKLVNSNKIEEISKLLDSSK
jgi:hypothetical protein